MYKYTCRLCASVIVGEQLTPWLSDVEDHKDFHAERFLSSAREVESKYRQEYPDG